MGVLDSAIVPLNPLSLQVGNMVIDVVPRIEGDHTIIDVNVTTPDGEPIENTTRIKTSLFNKYVEMAQRHNFIPRLSALVEQAAGHKPRLLPPKE